MDMLINLGDELQPGLDYEGRVLFEDSIVDGNVVILEGLLNTQAGELYGGWPELVAHNEYTEMVLTDGEEYNVYQADLAKRILNQCREHKPLLRSDETVYRPKPIGGWVDVSGVELAPFFVTIPLGVWDRVHSILEKRIDKS